MIKNKKNYLTICLIIFISTQMYGQVNTCGSKQSNFPVDIRILSIIDSIQKEGIDTILIYSHWVSTGSFNGYGKVIWKKNGNCYQIKVPFHNKTGMYGLGKQELRLLENDSIINFFFLNNIDTITKVLMQQTNNFRHDAIHFVKIKHPKKENCFVINGLAIQENPDNLLSKWIILLADEDVTFLLYDGIRVIDKKKRIKKLKCKNYKNKKELKN